MNRTTTRRMVATAAALATALTLAACSSADPEPAEQDPIDVVLENPATVEPTAEPTAEGTDSGEAAGPTAEPAEAAGLTGSEEEVVLPDGVELDDFNASVAAASGVARDFLEVKFASDWDDPDYDAWLGEAQDLTTADFHAELTALDAETGGREGNRTQREQWHESYHVQTLDDPLLASTTDLQADRIVLDVPFRTWETSDLAGDRAPFDTDLTLAGLEGTVWTRVEVAYDEATDRWLVDGEDPDAVVAGMYE